MSARLRVWAPHASEVSLVVDGHAHAMSAEAGGFFVADAPRAGADYWLRIDGRDRPDPRSRLQAHGVHGPSTWLGDAPAPREPAFVPPALRDALFYELHVGTFTPEGTYAAAAERLDHLAALGVTHVELMPIATFAGRHGWGYDGVDLFAPHPSYGTPDELARLVARCHARGFTVILDVVYNHLGPDGNYLREFGPYFTTRHRTPWGEAINLDGPGRAGVRRFLIDNACMWLERYGFDGLRLDAVHAMFDQSPVHFLAELGAEVQALGERLGRSLCLIAESEHNDPQLLRPRERGGFGLHAHWSDDFHHALHALLTGERAGYYAGFGQLAQLAHALQHGYVRGYHEPGSAPDAGAAGSGVEAGLGDASGDRLVVCMQNHDQVGNRARGERISHLIDPALVRIGAALLFVSPFVPLLFQGEEWGASTPFLYFADHQDPALAERIRRGRRDEFKAFGWSPEAIPDPLAASTYRASVLDWNELDQPPHRALLDWYTALAHLRRDAPELRDGRRERVQVEFDEAARMIRVARGGVTLLANLGTDTARFALPTGEVQLAHPAPPAIDDRAVVLEAHGCAIYRDRSGPA